MLENNSVKYLQFFVPKCVILLQHYLQSKEDRGNKSYHKKEIAFRVIDFLSTMIKYAKEEILKILKVEKDDVLMISFLLAFIGDLS